MRKVEANVPGSKLPLDELTTMQEIGRARTNVQPPWHSLNLFRFCVQTASMRSPPCISSFMVVQFVLVKLVVVWCLCQHVCVDAKLPPLLDKEWSSAYVEHVTNVPFTKGLSLHQKARAEGSVNFGSFSLVGWTHMSYSQQALRTDSVTELGTSQIFVDWKTTQTINILHYKRCCEDYFGVEDGQSYPGPDYLRQMGFQYEQTKEVPGKGMVDVFNLTLPGPSGYNYTFGLFFKKDTNIRVAYIVDAIEYVPLTHHHDEVWYLDYQPHNGTSSWWPDNFFSGRCPLDYTIVHSPGACEQADTSAAFKPPLRPAVLDTLGYFLLRTFPQQ